uniref:Retrotransposon Copia-like N-terminal domain-containing protein n=1 Tax=Cajanus cajan TaxID=3821 RepID=A0A151R3I9_CAJCA|nr:hypothetical protein KK1_041808 [Cajanus cajan]
MAILENLKEPSQDPTSPLFLHHFDGFGLVLTSPLLLGSNNYTTWSIVVLLVKNKLGFVNGSVRQPIPQPTANSPTHAAWMRDNNVIS